MLDPAHAVLVVVDVQGRLADIVHDADRTRRSIITLVRGARILDIPVIATEQYPKGLGHTVADVADALGGAPVIEKRAFSCCGEHAFTTMLDTLHRQDVLLCGIETHVCVYQTARDLLLAGYRVHLVQDAVSSRLAANRDLGISRIAGMGGVITGVEMALFEMLRESGTDRFKAISALVR